MTSTQIILVIALVPLVTGQLGWNMFSGGGGGGAPNLLSQFAGGNPFNGGGFNALSSGGGGSGGFSGFGFPAVNPALAQQSQLTTAEEQMGEILSESAPNDPARQRLERMFRQGKGKLTGAASPLNYLIQEYYMTTPIPTTPAPRPAKPPAAHISPFAQMNGQRQGQVSQQWAAGGQNRGGPPNMGGLNMGGPQRMGGRPAARRPRRRNRPGAQAPKAPVPTTTAMPDWQQWLFGSQTQAPPIPAPRRRNRRPQRQQFGPPRGRQRQGPPPPRNNGPPPPRRAAPAKQQGNFQQQAPTFQQQWGPPPPNFQSGPPPPSNGWFGPPPPAQKQPKSPQSTARTKASPSRTSIAVERLRNIQRRIDSLLNSQGGAMTPGADKQLAALREIRNILSGKNLNRPARATQGSKPSAKTVSKQFQPPYDIQQAQQPPYDPSLSQFANKPVNAAKNTNFGPGPAAPIRKQTRTGPAAVPAVAPIATGPAPNQTAVPAGAAGFAGANLTTAALPAAGGPAVTTAEPMLGDVKLVGKDKFVYTDADNSDVFLWVKVTAGPPAEGAANQPAQNQQAQQEGQNPPA